MSVLFLNVSFSELCDDLDAKVIFYEDGGEICDSEGAREHDNFTT
jgi:hypothetical protein